MNFRLLKESERNQHPNLPSQALVMLAVTDNDEIVGWLPAFDVVHLDGMFVDPSERGSFVAIGLWMAMLQELKDRGVKGFLVNAPREEIMDYCTRLGMIPQGITFEGRLN